MDVKNLLHIFPTFHGTILLQSHGQATFLVPKTVVISHPTSSLQYFTSHYFTLQKKLYSRASKNMQAYVVLLYFTTNAVFSSFLKTSNLQ